MFQNLLFQQYEDKTKNIDQIAQWTILCKQKKITQKYANIYSTVKLLKNLINEFTKKSHRVEQQFKKTAKIQILTKQTQLHQKRIQECQLLSKSLIFLIDEKQQNLSKYQIQAKQLRDQLIVAKTENIKKIVRIQQLQNQQKQNKEKDKKLLTRKVTALKIQQDRMFIKTAFNFKNQKMDILRKQREQVTKILWNKINDKICLESVFRQSYRNMKQKLFRQQKKSNIYGLTGSLLFKLMKNQDSDESASKPYLKLKHVDSKLMIYDVLKQKHSKQTRIQKQTLQLLNLPQQKFMTFNSIQILGLIQLKGGLKQLKKDNDQKKEEMSKKVKKQKKQNRYMTYVKPA